MCKSCFHHVLHLHCKCVHIHAHTYECLHTHGHTWVYAHVSICAHVSVCTHPHTQDCSPFQLDGAWKTSGSKHWGVSPLLEVSGCTGVESPDLQRSFGWLYICVLFLQKIPSQDAEVERAKFSGTKILIFYHILRWCTLQKVNSR